MQKIIIQSSGEKKKIFYTALYHALISPAVYLDVDGQYRGIDHNIHKAEGFTNYTIFSLWDTYRALHPLLTWLYPDRTADMVNSMLAHFDQSPEKMLPVWSHHGNENWCMIGYHGTAVIADAYVKGIRGFDGKRALEACITTSTRSFYEGTGDYMKYGFVPDEKSGNSASITLEYAYDDYAIACLAKALDDTARANLYFKRSLNYRNLFDPSINFIRPRNAEGVWKSSFDPLSTHGQGFIEGNSWNYSFFVPHDIPHYIGMMGGGKVFIRRLDSLFSMHLEDKYFKETEDVTRVGIIGNYVHGNEPSHHIAYLYDWTSQPWKTQEKIPMILKSMYRNAPDGLCGNDDCGQMSAWYIFSSLGFYPVCPGTTQYAIGSPFVEEAIISLPDNKKLTIQAKNLSDKNIYIESVTLNGKDIQTPFLDHYEIVNGGELIFNMTVRPLRGHLK